MRVTSAAVAVAFLLATPGVAAAHGGHGSHGHRGKGVKRIVVIYQENHSFDNLYGGWEGVNGVANADAAHTTQVNQAGTPYMCLKQDDVNLTSPPLPATCHDATVTPAFDSRSRTRRSGSTTSSQRPTRPAHRRATPRCPTGF